MHLFRHARKVAAVTAVVCAGALITSSTVAAAPPGPDPSKESEDFRKAVTVRGVEQHLDALQAVADANDGTRVSGSQGYAASRNYVVQKLRAAGYRPNVQTFQFPFFEERSPAQLEQTAPTEETHENPADFITMSFSGSGDTTADVVPVDTDFSATDTSTSGCESDDFSDFPDGAIALVQRGSCDFGLKADNAEAAGATAVIVFNRGTEGNTEAVSGTLGHVVGIPAVGVSHAVGQELGAPDTEAHVFTDTKNETRTTYNVTAETKGGNPDNVVMAGAHLDSVAEGPGINDNGSGSASTLEIAEQMAKVKQPKNKVRFAWWGAEEAGLLGATHYVDDLVENNPDALGDIALYLNFDMVGSPNFVRFVYDGDNSTGEGEEGPEGSDALESIFSDYFTSQNLASKETPFDGRSDYGPFIANGVPAGGLFTGAEGLKTAGEAAIFGGTAGQPYDACYHSACDDRANISHEVLDQMSDAEAHAIYVLSRSTKAVNGQDSGGPGGGPGMAKLKAGHAGQKGHLTVR